MIDNLYIIIPVHNRIHFTHDCLLSLHRQTLQGFQTVVIDDGSTDGTRRMIEKEFPKVILLNGDGNLWWTRATNLGVKHALFLGAQYIMTLNDDTVATEDYIEKMMFWATREPNAIFGAIAIDAITKKPIYGGEIVNWKIANYTSLLGLLKPDEHHGIHNVTHLPGRGMLVPSKVFHSIGFFDADHFPQCLADFDFTHRAAKAGYNLFCNYDSKILIYDNSITTLQFRKKKSFQHYYYHLFGLKSGANLVKFFYYSLKNCPTHLLPLFLSVGFSRRIFGYLLEWIDEILNTNFFKYKRIAN